ncbi:hypothetical protein J40TS1_34000 [Paenibacillus montaniterrae]|uniref:DUF2634 domain-containing protein n=1 Tax=Paenibacillus montaniterrae TaxID=429341 RepID=A0A919YPP1_9BACL|nr:DUF2634 domain-containing protein [Paenibacillus montaniterrae]GIP17758.1 hypothetical protein J40TS1_34000 [Paenibacillus montaniterrae]
MFPVVNYEPDKEGSQQQGLGYVLKFDFEQRKFVFASGKPVGASYEDAIKQWIDMVLLSEQGKYKVYGDIDFGLSISQFIGRKDLPISTISSEVRRQVEEQLTKHSEIVSVDDFNFERQDNKAVITFSVQTVNGSLIEGLESEVLFSG